MSLSKRQQQDRARLSRVLVDLGFTWDEAITLRNIEMTLHRWGERECGDGSDWAIERDEAGVAWLVYHGQHQGTYAYRKRKAVDHEKGALKRLAKIVAACNARRVVTKAGSPNANDYLPISFFYQTDPRGAAVYIIRPGDVREGEAVDSVYNRGICVCGRR